MGFFKDINKMRKTGKEMQKEQYGTSNPFKMMSQGVSQANEMMDQYQAEAAKAQKLMSVGIQGQATVKEMRDTGKLVNNMPEIEFDLDVQVEGRDPYTATLRQVVQHANLGQMQPGATVPVRVDPDDQNSLMIG